MNIEAFLLCDCATQGQGKLNVLGAFDSIYAAKVPAMHPACTIAARIRFSNVEQGDHKIRINVIDDDGSPIGPDLEKTISVRVPQNDNSSVINLILNIQGLNLQKYGSYRFDLAIDGRLEASAPLILRKAENQQ